MCAGPVPTRRCQQRQHVAEVFVAEALYLIAKDVQRLLHRAFIGAVERRGEGTRGSHDEGGRRALCYAERGAMVLGIGTDITEIDRIEASIVRFGERFLARIYTPAEIAYCRRKKSCAESFAARFAAKEAGAKALGTGISHGIGWKEIEVRREPGQRPTLHLTGRAAAWAGRMGVAGVSLSLTHSRNLAMAVVIMESSGR